MIYYSVCTQTCDPPPKKPPKNKNPKQTKTKNTKHKNPNRNHKRKQINPQNHKKTQSTIKLNIVLPYYKLIE